MTREAFLARIARALGRAPGSAVAEPPQSPAAAIVSPSTAELHGADALARHFEARATAVGVDVRRVRGARAGLACAAGAVAEFAGEGGACAGLDEGSRRVVHASGAEARAPAAAAVGVSRAWRGVAETGTVVLRSEDGRLGALLPPVHVVVLHEVDLRRSLVELYADLEGALPAGLVQITGPSRTADIEMTLTTGVHGPGTVVVVLVAPDEVPDEVPYGHSPE